MFLRPEGPGVRGQIQNIFNVFIVCSGGQRGRRQKFKKRTRSNGQKRDKRRNWENCILKHLGGTKVRTGHLRNPLIDTYGLEKKMKMDEGGKKKWGRKRPQPAGPKKGGGSDLILHKGVRGRRLYSGRGKKGA